MKDNYHTTINFARHKFERYNWTFVGTVVQTGKKTHVDYDIPFCKLPNDTKEEVKHGWFHEAVLECFATLGHNLA